MVYSHGPGNYFRIWIINSVVNKAATEIRPRNTLCLTYHAICYIALHSYLLEDKPTKGTLLAFNQSGLTPTRRNVLYLYFSSRAKMHLRDLLWSSPCSDNIVVFQTVIITNLGKWLSSSVCKLHPRL